MERLEVKDYEGEFEELPGTLTLDITMPEEKTRIKEKIRGQHSSGILWGSGSTGKQTIKLRKHK